MESTEARVREFGEEALREKVPGVDGKMVSKLSFLYLYVSHEMYHRGQISVYERLMQIEPALTANSKRFSACFAFEFLTSYVRAMIGCSSS